jgi:hypothetical protein
MSAMVDVLPAEIPPVDLEDLLLVFRLESERLPPDLHAMGGFDGLVKGFVPEAPAELGLPHAAIAEKNHLHLVLGLGAEFQLGKVGP